MSNLANKRILIVDDMASLRSELRSVLSSMGFANITEMPDGQAALLDAIDKLKNSEPYDFIFSDINMPNMNGLELLKKIRSLAAYKGIPFLLLSTENETAIILQAIMDGATDYIIKPYDANTVKMKVHNAIVKLKIV